MEKLIPIINKLQDVFTTVGSDPLDLPQIVVVGSQSAGKSSVLENVVGRDFLPRGSSIVTRRPLVLQLVHTPSTDKNQTEWGEFLHKRGVPFTDFGAIRDEILATTDEVAGRNKGVSRLPINLKIHSPNVVDLTLVDLPGITRIPLGDQPKDIEQQIRSMIMEYISRPNVIILALTAANTDISTSDALQMARQVDPEGIRTLGVLTKLDLMDAGTDACDVLMGKSIPLKLGYIGVVNRSQADIQAGKPIQDALREEHKFFAENPKYRSMATRLGTPHLAKTLNRLLLQHIRDALPGLRSKVARMLGDAKAELALYANPEEDARMAGGGPALLLHLITKFSTEYKSIIDGRLSEVPAGVMLQKGELGGGARICHVFESIFGEMVDSTDPLDGLSTNEIGVVIKNATGPRATLFVPETAFETLVRRQVTRLEEPALECVDMVYDELLKIVSQVEQKNFGRFEKLRQAVIQTVQELLIGNKAPAREMVKNLIRIELAYIKTSHPDFIGGDRAAAIVHEKLTNEARRAAMLGQQPQSSAPPKRPSAPPKKNQPPPQNCFNCGTPLSGSWADINAHLDQCLASSQQSKQAQEQATSGFWGKVWGSSAKQTPQGPAPEATTAKSPGLPDPSAQPVAPHQASTKAAASPAAPGAEQDPMASSQLSVLPASPAFSKERFAAELIQTLLISYFCVVRKSVKDTVPKAIMHFLVNSTVENLQSTLVHKLYREDRIPELLEESPEIAAKRAACLATIATLQKASDIINEVRESNL